MLIIWRTLLLALLSFGFLVCFPSYPEYTVLTVAIIFLVSVAVMIGITSLLSLILMGRFWFFNRVIDLVMLALLAGVLLFMMPLNGASVPYDNIARGDYPTKDDMKRGLKKLGVEFEQEDLKKSVEDTVKDVNDGLIVVHDMIKKEVNN